MRIRLLVLSLPTVLGSPFDPHPLPDARAFFEGWYLRVTDHEQNRSFAVVLGSLQPQGWAGLKETWAALIVDGGGATTLSQRVGDSSAILTEQIFPLGTTVTTGDQRLPVTREPVDGDPSSFDYTTGAGSFSVRDDTAELRMAFPSYMVQVSTRRRVPWSLSHPDSDGPEGTLFPWARGALLPCHYFVHSLGSEATYRLTPTALDAATPPLSGAGLAHMEANYGAAFPNSWIWTQGVAPGGRAQFVATALAVEVGSTELVDIFAVAFRSPTLNLTLRTPDLDIVKLQREPCAGRLTVEARNLLGGRRATLRISSTSISGQPRGFSAPLYTPTRHGFSTDPGCVESFTALATLSVKDAAGTVLSTEHFLLAALEFGGGWRCGAKG
mmetsp:Transcript_13705/g.44762  ORF Transcript_13705/g.44762 Transcript_13705/m.44762 type:complete len:384 (-) Transcript_13705:471-1622(-)|eukprot:scaffold13976_cov108-Isochrysis_galbana.AAC.2